MSVMRKSTKAVPAALSPEDVATSVSSRPSRSSPRFIARLATCVLVALIYLALDAQTPKQQQPKNLRISSLRNECTIWMAPSALQGNPGYGVFTTRMIQVDEPILNGPDGLSIPVTHSAQAYNTSWINTWDNYWWGRGVSDMISFLAPPYVMDYQVGFGALPNSHCILDSLTHEYPIPDYDDSMVLKNDPGRGAYSYSHGRQFTVTRPLEAGEEIYLNYGYCKHGPNVPRWTDSVTMPNDFNRAANMIWNEILQYDGRTGTLITTQKNPLIQNLLPPTKEDYVQLRKQVNTRQDIFNILVKSTLNARTPEWIQQNGMCLENLIPRPSRLPHAGQGAVAQFPIRKGERIAPAPALHIMDKNMLTIRDENRKVMGQQLLLNYCFGHPKSTLLLCPNTNVLLVNHCSHRTKECGRKGPNARVQWASGWDVKSDEWRKMSLKELNRQNERGLALEYVATRDILAGEEVFIDYGIEWEKAWKQHIARWKPPETITNFSVAQANEFTGPIRQDLISGNLRKVVDHPYLFTGCQYYRRSRDNADVYEEQRDWKSMADDQILDLYSDDGAEYTYGHGGYQRHSDTSHWPCSVIRQQPDGSYTVRLHQSPLRSRTAWAKSGMPRILTHYPKASIHYFVKSLVSDQFLPGVFRHPMGFPDDLFPMQWKTLP